MTNPARFEESFQFQNRIIFQKFICELFGIRKHCLCGKKMVSMKHFPGQPTKMCSTHHLGVVIVERCFPSCTWRCHIFSDVIMRKHFKNSKCSRDAKFFLSLPASPAAGADSPSGNPEGAVSCRTKTKRGQSAPKGENPND